MGIKILLADDSVTAQNMGKKILSEAGHEVVTVSNGAAAAKKIAEIKPELVLLDVFMPGYSGLELCERLRNAGATSKLPVLLTVGRMEPYNPQDGARVKADGVIVKPFEASDLTAAVDRIAEKLKSGNDATPQNGATPKQVAPQAEQPKGAKPADYEETVRMDSTQIAAVLKNGAAPEAPTAPAELPVSQKESATPAYADLVAAAAPVPATPKLEDMPTAAIAAFGSEVQPAPSAPAPATIPSYMTQYLTEEQPSSFVELTPKMSQPSAAPVKSRSEALPAIETSVPDEPSPAADPNAGDGLLQHFHQAPNSEPRVASAEGLEFTAAAPVGEIAVTHEAAFEPTVQSFEVPVLIPQDPAFESDPHHAAMDFPTHFGTAEATASDLPLATETGPAAPDEFEARLKAALSAYEEPSTDLPLPSSPADAGLLEIHTEPAAELTPSSPAHFESRLEAAMHAFDAAGEVTPEVAPHARAEVHASQPRVEIELDPLPSELTMEPEQPMSFEPASSHPVVEEETPIVEAVSDTTVHAGDLELETEVERSHAPEMDDVVIHQMRESFSHLPVESGHESQETQPMAMAAAAASTGAPLSREAEMQLARALTTALNNDSPAAESILHPQVAHPADANKLAAAVEKVMQRELPSLIWKIMAELDIKKNG